jgi:hypothetical protein
MGILNKIKLNPFTENHVRDRDLVIRMLKFEDSIIHSDVGTQIFRNPLLNIAKSLDADYAIKRLVLVEFDFDTSDTSLQNYVRIFAMYYKSPLNYDVEVMASVTQFRENRLLYNTNPKPAVGAIIPNCKMMSLNGGTLDLHSYLHSISATKYIIHAFSTS